jgi:hypothetical protein
VDNSSLGSIAYEVEVLGAGVRVNVVPLLHPSFAPLNQRLRAGQLHFPKAKAYGISATYTVRLARLGTLKRKRSSNTPVQVAEVRAEVKP